MQKLEFSVENGVEFVKEFSPETIVWSSAFKTMTVADLIEELGRPFEGVIGWEATDEDLQALKEAEYIK